MTHRFIFMLVILLILSACGNKRAPARVDEINTKRYVQAQQNKKAAANQKKNSQYKVKRGDTLYSIGFNYQMDYKFLAQINGINKPYRIYPGQTLKLKADSKKSYVTTEAIKTSPVISTKKITAIPLGSASKTTTQSTPKAVASTPKSVKTTPKPTVTSQPKAITQSKPAVVTPQPTKPQPSKPKVILPTITHTGAITWSWPTAGNIRSTFLASNPARKGISIGGKEGQAVKAAAPGVVVYSGSGLLGYGELIIIKHNDQFLSAYGHNKRRLVSEGDVIKSSQTIAELGSSGTNVDNLHFEIRKNGKPVNPLNYVKP